MKKQSRKQKPRKPTLTDLVKMAHRVGARLEIKLEPITPFKRGDWVAQHSVPQPHIGRVIDCYQWDTGEWLIDIKLWSWDGKELGRVSPALDGPKTWEPACPAENYRKIEPPNFPLRRGLCGDYDTQLKWL